MRRIYKISIFTILMLMTIGGSVSAKMYKWVDENGITHFSDVPPHNNKIEKEYDTVKTHRLSAEEIKRAKDLLVAAEKGNLESVKQIIEKGTNIDVTNKDGWIDGKNGWTPLMVASYKGHVDIAKLLIEEGASLNAHNPNGYTALFLSAKRGRVDIVKLLVGKGARLEATNNHGETALMHALWSKQFKTAIALLEAGASIRSKSQFGATACNIAWVHGNDEIRQILQRKGCNWRYK